MPHIDARSGEVVIRIVYDGAPEAGKTTNVQHLCNQISLARRGAAKSPGTTGARTEFFDWLDFSGGFLDGRRVRCQLVSVPGQSSLLHRRRYLLEAADVIVFVVDSRTAGIEEAGRNVATTLRIAARVAGDVPVGIILQANKQDLDGAMAPPDVLRALGMPAATPALGSVAATGSGVMDTFILAVRLATDRVRSLLKESVTDLPTSDETPDALHAAMLQVESAGRERTDAERLEAERVEAERVEAERIEAERIEAERIEAARIEAARLESERLEAERLEVERLAAERLEFERREAERLEAERIEADRVEAERAAQAEHVVVEFSIRAEESSESEPVTLPAPSVTHGTRRNLLERLDEVALPQAHEISSGHVWPPVKGRAAFAAAATGRLAAPEEVRPWAPASALEVASDAGWLLHSSDRWVFDDEATARLHLLNLVRRLLPQSELVPEARALAVAKDGDRWRMWLITPQLPSVREAAHAAIEEGSVDALVSFLGRVVPAFRRLHQAGTLAGPLPAGAAGLALQEGKLVQLVLDEGEVDTAFDSRPPLAELSEVMARLIENREGVREWFEAEGRALLERA